MSIDINPDNNRDTFHVRGVRIKELEEQILFLTKEIIDLKKTLEYQKVVSNQEFQKTIDIKNKLNELLETVQKSPREVTFDKEVLTLFINQMLK